MLLGKPSEFQVAKRFKRLWKRIDVPVYATFHLCCSPLRGCFPQSMINLTSASDQGESQYFEGFPACLTSQRLKPLFYAYQLVSSNWGELISWENITSVISNEKVLRVTPDNPPYWVVVIQLQRWDQQPAFNTINKRPWNKWCVTSVLLWTNCFRFFFWSCCPGKGVIAKICSFQTIIWPSNRYHTSTSLTNFL